MLAVGTARRGWATATWLALTMQGYWWSGRQTVVVLPLAVLAVARSNVAGMEGVTLLEADVRALRDHALQLPSRVHEAAAGDEHPSGGMPVLRCRIKGNWSQGYRGRGSASIPC